MERGMFGEFGGFICERCARRNLGKEPATYCMVTRSPGTLRVVGWVLELVRESTRAKEVSVWLERMETEVVGRERPRLESANGLKLRVLRAPRRCPQNDSALFIYLSVYNYAPPPGERRPLAVMRGGVGAAGV